MVKTRPDVKRHTKNTVSTSTMFKKPSMKHKNEAIRAEDAALRFFGVEKSSKIEKANKGMKRNKQRKVKKQVEHPLAAAFSDTLEGSGKSIQDQADADIDLALAGHELRLSRSYEHYSQLHEDAVQFNEALALPFRNQELEWTSTDGKQSGTTVLSVRMKKFEKTIEAEEKELILQHQDWVTIQQHLLEMAREMVGPAALDRWIAGDLDASTFMDGAAEKVELEIAAEKKKFVAQIEKLEKESMKKMKDSEKKLQLKQREVEESFMAMLRDDEY